MLEIIISFILFQNTFQLTKHIGFLFQLNIQGREGPVEADSRKASFGFASQIIE